MVTIADVVHLTDVLTGSAATLTPVDDTWQVRESGPINLWERIETVLSAYDTAGRPEPESFRLHITHDGHHLRQAHMPTLSLRSIPD
jgi:hypothetical protein